MPLQRISRRLTVLGILLTVVVGPALIVMGAAAGSHCGEQGGWDLVLCILTGGSPSSSVILLALVFALFVGLVIFLLRQTAERETALDAATAELAGRIEVSTQAILNSEERFRTLVQNLSGIVYRCAPDRDWTMEYMSEVTEEITGYPVSDFIHNHVRSFASIIHPDDREAVQDTVGKAIAEGGSFVVEYRIVHADQSVRWVYERGMVIRNHRKRQDHLDGFILDVTDQREAERKARENTHLLQTIIDHIPALIFMKDRLGRYMMVNRAWEQATGIDRSDAIDRDDIELQRPDREEVMALDQRVFQTGEKVEVETALIYPDGTPHVHHLLRSPVYSERGFAYALVGIRLDITARKEVERDLARARDEAELANSAKSAFLANMSHEIRTPLNAVLGYSRLMQRDATLSAEQRERLATINRSGEHLLTLINTILEASKLEAGQAVAEITTFSLIEVLDDLESMFHLRAREKRLQLRFDLDRDLPEAIVSDEGKVRQILINLINNALNFTERGSVRVRARPTRFRPQDDPPLLELRIDVIDTGVGIRDEDRAQIFQAFGQAREGRLVQGGTGLGLAISREYAELLGGRLEVDSEWGRGSRFTLVLHCEFRASLPRAARARQRQVVGLAEGCDPIKILVADDHAPNRDVLVILLEEAGFNVLKASTGSEAIDIFAREQPPVVFLDIAMPKVDGLDAAAAIRARPNGDHTKIFALTASIFSSDRERLESADFDEIIRKPYRDEVIFEAISRHTDVRFRYASEEALPDKYPASKGLEMGRAFRDLPPVLREQLQIASDSGALSEIARLVAEVRPHNAELADHLESLAHSFNLHELAAVFAAE